MINWHSSIAATRTIVVVSFIFDYDHHLLFFDVKVVGMGLKQALQDL